MFHWPRSGLCLIGVSLLLTCTIVLSTAVIGKLRAGSRATPLLVISVSSASKEIEFLVLRWADDGVQWDATAIDGGVGGRRSGHVQMKAVDLAALFVEVSKSTGAADIDSPLESDKGGMFASLLLVDEQGAKACMALDAGQRSALRRRLEPVFEDVRRGGLYAKPSLMQFLVFPVDSLWQTGKVKGELREEDKPEDKELR